MAMEPAKAARLMTRVASSASVGLFPRCVFRLFPFLLPVRVVS